MAIHPGIIFTDEDNVIPDVVWASNERLDTLMDEAEHLTGAPDLESYPPKSVRSVGKSAQGVWR